MSTIPVLYDSGTSAASIAEAKPIVVSHATDLKWLDADKTSFSCVVTFSTHPLGITEPLPFIAHMNDPEAHGKEIFYRALQGEFGAIADFAPDLDALAADARAKRDALLDSTQRLVDRHRDELDAGVATTLSSSTYAALQTYRQALRDLTDQDGFPLSITWPVSPV
jgi:hypothetical protein